MGVPMIQIVGKSKGEDVGSSESHGIVLVVVVVRRKVTGPARTGMEARVSRAGNLSGWIRQVRVTTLPLIFRYFHTSEWLVLRSPS